MRKILQPFVFVYGAVAEANSTRIVPKTRYSAETNVRDDLLQLTFSSYNDYM